MAPIVLINPYIHGGGGTPAPEPPASAAAITFNASAGDNTLHLRSETSGFDGDIYWGDGTTSTCPVDGGNVVHNYASAGEYTISIDGTKFAGFYVALQSGADKYLELNSMGDWSGSHSVDILTNAFLGAANLDTVTAGALDNITSATSGTSMFRLCSSLTTLPTDLFKYCTAITSMTQTFKGTGITSVPTDLFRYNTLVTSFAYVFEDCSSLTTVPADTFRYNTLVTILDFAFSGSGIDTIPSGLFQYNTAVTSMSSLFANCTSLTSIPADLFRYNTSLGIAASLFDGCSSLTTVPADTFRYNTLLGSARIMFANCTSLETLPADLFRYNTRTDNHFKLFYNCPKLQLRADIFGTDYSNRFTYGATGMDFRYTFQLTGGFTGTQGTAPDLWNFTYTDTSVSKTDCFDGHSTSSVDNYASIPAEWL